METEDVRKSKIISLLEKIPSWVQMVVTLGTLIFGIGTMYASIQDLKGQMISLKDVPAIDARQDADLLSLHQQINDDKATQLQTAANIDKLADAVSSLSTSVARLEGKLDAEDKKRR